MIRIISNLGYYMSEPSLVLPSVKYKDSFIEAVKEYKEVPHFKFWDLDVRELEKNFQAFISVEKAKTKGIGLKPQQVPRTIYWLVDEEEYIGRVIIRHRDNDYLLKNEGHIGYGIRPSKRGQGYGGLALRLALEITKEKELRNKVLLTCLESNIASKKIIESHGGKFSYKKKTSKGNIRLYYWLKLD